MNTSKTKDKYQIAIIPGDGIGKEVMEATLFVLDGLDIDFDYIYDGLSEVKKGEMGWQWPVKLFTQTDYTFEPEWTYDAKKLDEEISRYRVVADLQERVAKQEMIRHEFLDNDWKKQRTTYADFR